MTQGIPQWVTDRINADIAASNAAAAAQPVSPPVTQPVPAGGMSTYDPSQLSSRSYAQLPPEAVAGLQNAYGPTPVAPSEISPQQYAEMAAAEELARRRGQAPVLPAALARVTPIQQPAPQVSPPSAAGSASQVAPEQAATTDDPGALAYLSAAYARGTQQRVPERIAKVGEQYQQRGFGALPGDVATVLPNVPAPGVDSPTAEQMGEPLYWPNTTTPVRARDEQGNASGEVLYRGPNGQLEPYSVRYQRLMAQNAAARPATAVQPSQFERAQTAQQEAENEALLDQRLALSNKAEQQDQYERDLVLVGRGLAQRQLELQRDEEARRATIDKHVGEIDQLIQKRSTEVQQNPVTRYWQDKGAWGRLATAISVGMGAAGQALAGGQNAALELVNREIDGEIMRQRQIVDSLGTVIAAKRTILGDLLSKFRDPQAADQAARAIFLAQMENLYRRQALKESSEEMRASMSSLADALAMQREQAKIASIGAERTAAYAWQPARTVGQVGGLAGLTKLAKDLALTPEQERQMKLAYAKDGPKGAEEYLKNIPQQSPTMTRDEKGTAEFNINHKVFLPDGSVGYVKDKGDFEKAMASISTSQTNLGRLRKYVLSGSPWNATDRANVEAITNMAMGEIRVMLGLGVMSESDKELAMKLTGEFVNDRVGMADKNARLDTLLSLINQKKDEYVKRVSIDPNANTAYAPKQIVTRKAR